MPGMYEDPYLPRILAKHIRQLQAMQSQQQMVWSNLNGVPIMVAGRIPGSNPSSYGLQLVDPTSHAQVAFFGESEGSGTTALQFFDQAGNRTAQIDFEGLHIYDDSGTEQCRLGLLNASPAIYGLAVLNSAGTLQRVAGSTVASAIGTYAENTNTAWVGIGNTVTAEVGPSGQAQVTVNGIIGTTAATDQGSLSLFVDGTLYTDFPHAVASSDNADVGVSVASTFVVTGLAAGSHTFRVAAQTSGAYTVNFDNPVVTVTPF